MSDEGERVCVTREEEGTQLCGPLVNNGHGEGLHVTHQHSP